MSFNVDYRNCIDQSPENQAALAIKAVSGLTDIADLIGDIDIDGAIRCLADRGWPQRSLDLLRSLLADFTALMNEADEAAERNLIDGEDR